jgi:hypothetical protein
MDVLTQKLVKTRKPHTCFGCGRAFPAGTSMEFSTIADDGTVNNSYLCKTCVDVVDQISSEYGYFEYGFGELRDDSISLESERKQRDNI